MVRAVVLSPRGGKQRTEAWAKSEDGAWEARAGVQAVGSSSHDYLGEGRPKGSIILVRIPSSVTISRASASTNSG